MKHPNNRLNMKTYKSQSYFRLQQGAATLLVSIILLLATTLITIFAARVGVMDQRISGNELRHKEAFSHAEAGLEQASAYLSANPALYEGNLTPGGWATCAGSGPDSAAGSDGIFPCSLGEEVEMVYGTVVTGVSITPLINSTQLPTTLLTPSPTSPTNTLPLFTSYLIKTDTGDIVAIGQGISDDETGAAIAQVSFAETSLLTQGEVPPLMVPSGNLNGNFNIVPNPNGGGPGVPISVWSNDTLDTSGANWKTCDHGDFLDGGDVCMDTKLPGDSWSSCSCSTERSNKDDVNGDIVIDSESNFPASPFVYMFGGGSSAPIETLFSEIKAQAEAQGLVLSDCDTLSTEFNALAGSALVWIEGETGCDINSNVQIGSRAKPIILVVEGPLKINAAVDVWGILIGLAEFSLNGGPIIHGSAISEGPSDLTNGNYSQVYDQSVFENLRDDSINRTPAKVNYSWRDFTP